MDSLGFNLLYAAVALWLGYQLWCGLRGRAADVDIPGSVPAPLGLLGLAVVGSLVILGLETGGEIALGIAGKQSTLPWFALAGLLAAAVVEEVIFRGYVVFRRGEEVRFWLTALVGSVLFTGLHSYGWETPEGSWLPRPDLSVKALFSSGIVFLNSVFFYALRFRLGNQGHSLLPCILAHAVSNAGVYLVKAAQGFVSF